MTKGIKCSGSTNYCRIELHYGSDEAMILNTTQTPVLVYVIVLL